MCFRNFFVCFVLVIFSLNAQVAFSQQDRSKKSEEEIFDKYLTNAIEKVDREILHARKRYIREVRRSKKRLKEYLRRKLEEAATNGNLDVAGAIQDRIDSIDMPKMSDFESGNDFSLDVNNDNDADVVEITVRELRADESWQPVTYLEEGETWLIKAKGRWSPVKGGDRWNIISPEKAKTRENNKGTWMGKIGKDGGLMRISGKNIVTVKNDGVLFMKPSDQKPGDNRGSLTIKMRKKEE